MAFIVIASAEQGLDDMVRLIQVLGCVFRDSAHEPGTVLARHSYVIHLDQSAPESLHEQVRGLQQQVHEEQWLHVLDPIDVSWGGPSMLQVILEGVRVLVEAEEEWRHVLVVSGSDYPIVPVSQMSTRYAALPHYSHFEVFQQNAGFLKNRGLHFTFVECAGWNYKIRDNRPPPTGIELWGGSSWVALSRTFSHYVERCLYRESKRDPTHFFRTINGSSVGRECRLATDLLAYMEHTQSAEELYLHSLFMNSQHCVNVHTKYWRWVHWGKRRGRHCDKSDYCGTSPQYVTAREVRTAHYFTEALFARKFQRSDNRTRDLADGLSSGAARYARLDISKSPHHAHKALDGNDYSAWPIKPSSIPTTVLSVTVKQRRHVCSATISVGPSLHLPPSCTIAVGIYARTNNTSHWTPVFPITPFASISTWTSASAALSPSLGASAEVEGKTDGWVLYRLNFASKSLQQGGVRGRHFEMRLSEVEVGVDKSKEHAADNGKGVAHETKPSSRRFRPFEVYEFQLHACGDAPSVPNGDANTLSSVDDKTHETAAHAHLHTEL